MRFLIREQDFETPLASGKYVYELEGRPTGLIEEWRLNQLPGEHYFLRVDLDGREQHQPESTLYHLSLGPAGQPDRLKFRYFAGQQQINGDVLFSDDAIVATRMVNGRRIEEIFTPTVGNSPSDRDFPSAVEVAFWFPSVMGFYLLAASLKNDDLHRISSLTLFPPGNLDKTTAFSLDRVELKLSQRVEEQIVVGGESISTRPWSIGSDEWNVRLWLDDWGRLPVRMERDDRLLARASYVIRRRACGPPFVRRDNVTPDAKENIRGFSPSSGPVQN